MSDLIERYRHFAAECRDMKQSADLWNEAADALEGKDKRIAELEAELGSRKTFPEYDDAISAISKENERLESDIDRQMAIANELANDNERLRAVYEAAKEHVEWCRLNRGQGYSRLEQALAAAEEASDE